MNAAIIGSNTNINSDETNLRSWVEDHKLTFLQDFIKSLLSANCDVILEHFNRHLDQQSDLNVIEFFKRKLKAEKVNKTAKKADLADLYWTTFKEFDYINVESFIVAYCKAVNISGYEGKSGNKNLAPLVGVAPITSAIMVGAQSTVTVRMWSEGQRKETLLKVAQVFFQNKDAFPRIYQLLNIAFIANKGLVISGIDEFILKLKELKGNLKNETEYVSMYEKVFEDWLPDKAVLFLQEVCRIGEIGRVIALEDMKNSDTNHLGNVDLIKQFNSMLENYEVVGARAIKLAEIIKFD